MPLVSFLSRRLRSAINYDPSVTAGFALTRMGGFTGSTGLGGTVAIDVDTRESMSSDIQKLKSSTTVVLIAHYLSSVLDANLVLYMDDG
jgi:hypothetical protein